MIDEVHINDVALIREATFSPCASLTVVTGETGAGKTALLNALKLLVGERAEAGMVREGAGELSVEGRFFFGDTDVDGVVASRRIGAQGRSRVTVNGALASVGQLAEGVGRSVDLCGQHEHQRLLSASYQRTLLDAWGGEAVARLHGAYRAALDDVAAAQAELDRLRALAETDAVELDRARFALEQIDAVDPQEGEYEELLERLPRLENGELLVGEADAARRALSDSNGALERLDVALASLDRIAGLDAEMEGQAASVREAYYTLEEVSRALASYRDQVDFPRDELEAAQDRVAELQGLMRGFGPRMDDVFERARASRERLAEYEGRDELIAAAQAALDAAEGRLTATAQELRAARLEVAPRFSRAVCDQLARLEMPSARFEAHLADLPREEWSAWGPQAFELLFSSSEAARPMRLGRIASGGEMSRVMLAVKVALGDVDEVDTLVFDEIDAGVGGTTALALGEVLSDLACTHQVIVVTHLPQVAVRGDAHYLVKRSAGDAPETTLAPVVGEDRVREIARMLSGEVNDTSCTHARELLNQAKGAR